MPLIEEISSSSCGDLDPGDHDSESNKNDDAIAAVGISDVLDRLGQHYRQSIHHQQQQQPSTQQQDTNLRIDSDNDDDDDDREIPPMVLALVQRLMGLLLQRVDRSTTTSGAPVRRPAVEDNNKEEEVPDGASSILLGRLWNGYGAKIRPVLFRSSSSNGILQDTGVTVLVHYELLVSEFLRQQRRCAAAVAANLLGKWNVVVEATLEALLQDITTAQSLENSTAVNNNGALVVVLPTLLRLMYHLIRCCRSTLVVDNHQQQQQQQLDPSLLCRCQTILLPLSSEEAVPSCPVAMDPEIPRQLLDPSLFMDPQLCLSAEDENEDHGGGGGRLVLPNDLLEIVGLGSSSLPQQQQRPAATPPPSVVVTRRLANAILAECIPAATTTTITTTTTIATNNNERNNPAARVRRHGNEPWERPVTLAAILLHDNPNNSLTVMTRTVRAHFFGRDAAAAASAVANSSNTNNSTKTTTAWDRRTESRLHLGHEVTTTRPKVDPARIFTPPYQSQPSRLRVALAWMHCLDTMDASIWEEVLPIIYELLASSKDECVRWGAVSLFHLLQCRQNDGISLSPQAVDNLLSMLSNAVRICRIGATLAVLGLSQRHLLQLLFRNSWNSNKNSNVVALMSYEQLVLRRRKVTQQWLSLLAKNNGHVTHDYLVWGLLAGGVTPLLYDHAHNGENADALELGRLGLEALLPVLRGDCGFSDLGDEIGNDLYEQQVIFAGYYEDMRAEENSNFKSSQQRRQVLSLAVQVSALGALSNLLIAAHPVMRRHAGKLLCESLAYLQRHSERPLIRSIAFEIATRALVVSGGPGHSVWKRILALTEPGDPKVSKLLRSIEARAEYR